MAAHAHASQSKEHLRHDLGIVLEAFVMRGGGLRAQSVAAAATVASAKEQQQQHGPASRNLSGPVAAAAASLCAVAHGGGQTGAAASRSVLPSRSAQNGRLRSGPSSAPVLPKRGHLATDGGAVHRLPSPPATKQLQGRPAPPPPPGAVATAQREQITLPTKVYSDYSQAPPAKEGSTQLTVKCPVADASVSGVLQKNRSIRSDLTSERDVLYEKVAQRLDEIATEINRKYFSSVDDGLAQSQLTAAVRDLVKDATAKSFNSTVSRLIRHDQPEVQQLALLYQLTAAAIHTVGTGTTHACQLTDLCIQYAFDRFASFIMAKGGLELALGDSDFEVD